MSPAQQFAANLRARRRAGALTQEDLSRLTGLHTTEISRLERAVRDPRLSTIVRVAEGLGVPPSKLLEKVG